VSIKLVPGGKYQLITGEHESYLMDAADWELRPASIEQIVPTVSTLAHAGGGGWSMAAQPAAAPLKQSFNCPVAAARS
jgi:hypothetical protein